MSCAIRPCCWRSSRAEAKASGSARIGCRPASTWSHAFPCWIWAFTLSSTGTAGDSPWTDRSKIPSPSTGGSSRRCPRSSRFRTFTASRPGHGWETSGKAFRCWRSSHAVVSSRWRGTSSPPVTITAGRRTCRWPTFRAKTPCSPTRTTANRSVRITAVRAGWLCRCSTPGRAPSGQGERTKIWTELLL